VERVARLTLDGHLVEVSGGPSAPATIAARDVFPPAVPQGLEAVADDQGSAIDLSWTPGTEADLAGYRVYRRIAASSEPAARVSGTTLLPDPAWRDQSAQAGVRYAYSVSATDKSGNESARSPEVLEILSK
jgi:fibronectin type 3 domain-containing protein